MQDHKESSPFVQTHQPCEDCGSSDALSIRADGSAYCFACEVNTPGESKDDSYDAPPREPPDVPGFLQGEYRSIEKRGLFSGTCRKYGYRIAEYTHPKTKDRCGVHVADYYDDDGNLVGQKVRFPDKTFITLGKVSSSLLYGKHLYGGGGRQVVITEGEIDCLSVSQAWDNRYPVVSLSSGATSAKKAIEANLEWLSTFERVVLCFDSDEPGQKAANEAAMVLPPGKAFIAKLPRKDANEMLVSGEVEQLTKAIWQAREYRPDGVVNAAEIWERINKPKEVGWDWPFERINNLFLGIRRGEANIVLAKTSVGKSQFLRETAYSLITSGLRVGYIALEESVEKTGLWFLGLHLGKRIYLDPESVPEADRREAFDSLFASGRVHLYDHFGSLNVDNLISKIDYMTKALGCDVIFLDHITIVTSGSDDGNERKTIDIFMTKLRSLIERNRFAFIGACHVTEDRARGSSQIEALADGVILLKRNLQAKTEEERNRVRVSVKKNRFEGTTGPVSTLLFDRETGRLEEDDWYDEEEENDGSIFRAPKD